MIQESLKVKNVGPLKNIHLKELKPLTVLIGNSSSGKSTLMKVIALVRYIYKYVNVELCFRNSHVLVNIPYISFQDFLKDDLKNLITADSEIEYNVHVNNHSYTLSYKNGKLTTPVEIPNNDLMFFKEAWVSEMRRIIPAWTDSGSLYKDCFSFGFYFDETFGDFDDATNVVKDIDLDYLDMKLEVVKGGNNQKKYIISPNDASYGAIELKFASSGIQTTAPLMTLVKYFSSEFSFKEAMRRSAIMVSPRHYSNIELGDLHKWIHLYVESPELNLDSYSQRHLVDTMMRYIFHKHSEDREMGLVLATHSHYIVNYLNLLLGSSYSRQGRESYPYITPDSVSVYKITADGNLMDLMATDDESGQLLINDLDFVIEMEDIYNEYYSI